MSGIIGVDEFTNLINHARRTATLVDWTPLAEPIQDQGQCGSCTRFGLTGVIEALYYMKYGKHVKLSEKDGFACTGASCSTGDTMENPLNYARDVGISTEKCCPYGDMIDGVDHPCGDGRCTEWWQDGVKIASWKKLSMQTDIDAAIREGPLFISMAVPQSFMNYASGIYHSLGEVDKIVGYHAIGCFGKNFTEGWLEVRNSWGAAGWGEKSLSDHIAGEEGWFRVKCDDAALELEYYKVVVDGPIPEPQPTPSPCARGNTVAKIMSFFSRLLRRRGRFYYLNP